MGNHNSGPRSTAASEPTRTSLSPRNKYGKKPSKDKKGKKPQPNPEETRLRQSFVAEILKKPGQHSEAMVAAMKWVNAKNAHNIMSLYTITNPEAIFHFPDMDVHLPMRPFWDAMVAIFSSFPDLNFSFTAAKEVRPGVIVLENYIGGGHHTGSNFEFPPQKPIPPTGAYVADEPIRLELTVEDGKIAGMNADTMGTGIAGPPGFYAKAKLAYELQRK